MSQEKKNLTGNIKDISEVPAGSVLETVYLENKEGRSVYLQRDPTSRTYFINAYDKELIKTLVNLTPPQLAQINNITSTETFEEPIGGGVELLDIVPIPDTVDGLRILGTTVLTKYDLFAESKTAVVSVALGSLIAASPILRRIIEKSVRTCQMPLKNCLAELGYNGPAITEPARDRVLLNWGFMLGVSYAKEVTSKSFEEYQVKRSKAFCTESGTEPVNKSEVLPHAFCQDLTYFCTRSKKLIINLINEFLIPDLPPSATNMEKAYRTQFSLACNHGLMHIFQFTINLLQYMLNSPLISVAAFRKEVNNSFKNAYDLYTSTPADQRPYIRLLELPDHTKLHYRNFPAVHYATFVLVKWMAPVGDSIANLAANDLGLDQVTRVMIVKAIGNIKITDDTITEAEYTAIKEKYPAIKFTKTLEELKIVELGTEAKKRAMDRDLNID